MTGADVTTVSASHGTRLWRSRRTQHKINAPRRVRGQRVYTAVAAHGADRVAAWRVPPPMEIRVK
jgi:hypothetical protein